MKYTKDHLNQAVEKNIFTREQVEQFIELIDAAPDNATPLQKILYYGGSLIIISALTWLLGASWASFGSEGLVLISGTYFVVFLLAGFVIFHKKSLKLLGSLLLCVAIAVTPLLVFSVLVLTGYWTDEYDYSDFYIWVRGKWIVMELITIAVALII